MNLTDYQEKYFFIYKAFAETIRFILKKALLATDSLPRPQSIQCRAKGLGSLRRRLSEKDRLDIQNLELERRDLAGVRLIFYTNNDVDRFISSPLNRRKYGHHKPGKGGLREHCEPRRVRNFWMTPYLRSQEGNKDLLSPNASGLLLKTSVDQMINEPRSCI